MANAALGRMASSTRSSGCLRPDRPKARQAPIAHDRQRMRRRWRRIGRRCPPTRAAERRGMRCMVAQRRERGGGGGGGGSGACSTSRSGAPRLRDSVLQRMGWSRWPRRRQGVAPARCSRRSRHPKNAAGGGRRRRATDKAANATAARQAAGSCGPARRSSIDRCCRLPRRDPGMGGVEPRGAFAAVLYGFSYAYKMAWSER